MFASRCAVATDAAAAVAAAACAPAFVDAETKGIHEPTLMNSPDIAIQTLSSSKASSRVHQAVHQREMRNSVIKSDHGLASSEYNQQSDRSTCNANHSPTSRTSHFGKRSAIHHLSDTPTRSRTHTWSNARTTLNCLLHLLHRTGVRERICRSCCRR